MDIKVGIQNNKFAIATGLGGIVIGAAAGVAGSYIYNRRKTRGEILPLVNHDLPDPIGKIDAEEILHPDVVVDLKVDTKDFNESVEKIAELGQTFIEETLSTTTSEVVELEQVIVPEPEPEEIDEGIKEPESKNVFAGSDDDWDYEKELANRTNQTPYVLHKDEFFDNEKEYAQISLTYYAGDDILVDEDETPVYNHSQLVGPMMFGHGSQDPNVFYVRNDKRKAEYEIMRDSGMYSKQVLGLDIEDNARRRDLQHSHHTPRFHLDD